MLSALVNGKYAVIRKDQSCVDAAGANIAEMPIPEVVQVGLIISAVDYVKSSD